MPLDPAAQIVDAGIGLGMLVVAVDALLFPQGAVVLEQTGQLKLRGGGIQALQHQKRSAQPRGLGRHQQAAEAAQGQGAACLSVSVPSR